VAILDRSTPGLFDDQSLGRKEPNMIIMGSDYHPSEQHIAFVDTGTGKSDERRPNYGDQETEKFYRDLRVRGVSGE
jgi:hypothetical protein